MLLSTAHFKTGAGCYMGKHIVGGAHPEGLPISEAVSAGGFVFLSGLVGFDATGAIVKGGVQAETKSILDEAQRLLGLAGGELSDVVKVNVYLSRAEDFDAFNAVYRERFAKSPPARISMCVKLTIDALIELDLIAYTGDHK
jgi:2-iminobutanoate/2-iminopropanoate deaminase